MVQEVLLTTCCQTLKPLSRLTVASGDSGEVIVCLDCVRSDREVSREEIIRVGKTQQPTIIPGRVRQHASDVAELFALMKAASA